MEPLDNLVDNLNGDVVLGRGGGDVLPLDGPLARLTLSDGEGDPGAVLGAACVGEGAGGGVVGEVKVLPVEGRAGGDGDGGRVREGGEGEEAVGAY